jgi:hypothetical protein
VLRNFTALADASTSILTTDIPVGQLPQLVELAWKAKDLPITTLQLVPPLITPAEPDFADIAEHVDDALSASQTAGAAPDASPEEAPAATAEASDQPAAPTAEPSEQPAADQAGPDEESQPTGELGSVCAYE